MTDAKTNKLVNNKSKYSLRMRDAKYGCNT